MKKSILSLGLMFIFSFVMFLGTTYAWWSETIPVNNNLIVAGELDATFEAADELVEGDLGTAGYVDLSTEGAKIIDFQNVQPGSQMTRYIKISNTGTVDMAYKLDLVSNAGDHSVLGNNIIVGVSFPGVGNYTLTANQILDVEGSIPYLRLNSGQSVIITVTVTINTALIDNQGENEVFDFNVVLYAKQAKEIFG